MAIINMIVFAIIFLVVGLMGIFSQDKTWEMLERMRISMGDDRKYKRTKWWDISTRIGGIVFLLFGLFTCYLIFGFIF